jgi:Ca2+-transporting ATPase
MSRKESEIINNNHVTKNFFNKGIEEICKDLGLSKSYTQDGLDKHKVDEKLEKFGFNEIPRVSRGFFRIYLAPLFNWLIVIYLIGSLILFIAGILGLESNFMLIYLTLGIVAVNCLVAIFQQFRATKKLKALRELSAPTSIVIRSGQKQEILTREIVVGDLLTLNMGDKIGADARIIQSANLEVNESSLTGESESVKKNNNIITDDHDIPIGARKNMVFHGTFITMGTGTAIVVEIGGSTEIGKISTGLETAGTGKIPVQEKMNNFGKWLGLLVTAFWLGALLILWITTDELDFVQSLNAAMDIMPINIPLLTTIILLTGVLAMAQKGVIIRNLTSVDSLGRVSVICSDKTGTLTESKMVAQYIWVKDAEFIVTGTGYNPEGDIISLKDPTNPIKLENISKNFQLKKIMDVCAYCNNSSLSKTEIKIDTKVIDAWEVVGSPSEGALKVVSEKIKNISSSLDTFERIYEYPFDSTIKRMSVVVKGKTGLQSLTKGANEVLLNRCTKLLTLDGEIEITSEIKKGILDFVNVYASKGYRVLSLCFKTLDASFSDDLENENSRDICESDMTFIGFVTILDPPRAGVEESVKLCKKSGIDVVMITGDSPVTAAAIASQLSIITDKHDMAIEGYQIKEIKDFDEFNNVKVFARVSPEHKEDIIKKYQNEKKIVAMTGDGVNDALALNMADAGVAMGIQGTDVAKEAADMIITDDSFNSIITGIREGRGIFAKIRSVVFFFIVINLFEGLVGFILSIILDLPYFQDELFTLQWVFLSLTVHMFPGLILTFDTTSKDVMLEKPRDSEEILSKKIVLLMIFYGILLSISIILVYFLTITGIYPIFNDNITGLYPTVNQNISTGDLTSGVNLNHAKALTMLMLTIFFCESILIFQIRRPNKSLLRAIKEDSNIKHYLIVGFMFLILVLLIYIPGFQVMLANFGFNFMFVSLNAADWFVSFCISMICVVGFEIVKFAARKKEIIF